MDRSIFYAMLRRRDSGLFGTSLSQKQVDGLEAILDEGERRAVPVHHLAYILATAYHETGRKMQPVRENLNYSVTGLLKTFGRHRISKADAQKYGRSGSRKADQVAIANIIYGGEWGRKNLGNTRPGDGWLFRGGGLPQLTGRANFSKFGIADNPDAITDMQTAVRVMFDGMIKGLFTGKKLSDYSEFRPMRKIINAMDAASDIALYAINFQKVLHASGYDPDELIDRAIEEAAQEVENAPQPVPAPEPAPEPPSAPQERSGRNSIILGGLILIAAILLYTLAKG